MAYKCMTKTHIQTRIQMYEKNRHTNVWQGDELPRLQLSAHQSFFWAVSGDWIANPLVIGRPHSPLRYGQAKYKHKNIRTKPAYKCMKKNMHTNVWQKHLYKHAYKCMTKTRIQTRIQMYDKKQAYKCMIKTRTKSHTNVWQKHTYKHVYKCMKKTRIQMYDKNA